MGFATLTPCTYVERDWLKEIMGDGERRGGNGGISPMKRASCIQTSIFNFLDFNVWIFGSYRYTNVTAATRFTRYPFSEFSILALVKRYL